MDDTAIKVENLSKTFKLPHEKYTSLKSAFVNFYRKRTYETQRALDDISLEIKKGEFFGIIGRNGSGKSTLLKLLAGIYAPTRGTVTINGSLTPFIELGVGFNPELSGRDNVYLNGALLGFNRKQMRAMYKDIVEFAELEKFMDQKLKNYSSGMQVRLAFSIAIRAQSDILLLDEVLAVGDSNFRQKCMEVFHDLKENNRTIVLVSHDTVQIERFCDRVAVIDNSKLIKIDLPSKAIELYDEINKGEELHETPSRKLKITESDEARLIPGYKPASIEATLKDKEITINLPFRLIRKLPEDTVAAITIENEEAHTIYAYTTEQDNDKFELKNTGRRQLTFTIANVFPEGRYFVDAGFFSKDRAITFLKLENFAEVKCEGLPQKEWLIRAPTKLHLK
ncbi:MAG TPA: polysaccharide ABC transporter ATP-binding protein [Candidatus Saccharimonadales bacterium]